MAILKILGLLMGFWALGAAAAQADYTAPDGFYSLVVPDGWRQTAGSAGSTFSKNETQLSLLSLPAESPDAAIALAFERAEIAPAMLVSAVDAPLPNGVWKQEIYAEGTALTIALAQARDSRALVLIITGEQADVQAINPQILQLLTSISFSETPPRAHVEPSAFQEREVRFGAEPFVLNGTLSLPKGAGAFPAVVIVHGSGPQNRDGLLGPLTPYRDLAHGLASRGIAALRYDKRTFTYGADMAIDASFTIDDESIDDALSAVKFLRQQGGIDSARIFILGHSQGGMVAPRILARDDEIAGGILLAAPTRPFSAVLDEQLAYLAQVNPDALESAAFATLRKLAANYRQVAAGASYADAFGESALYFESLDAVDPLGEARHLAQPLLILHGERDYQATMADFAGWQAEFAADARVTLRSYPALNHMFMAQGDHARLAIPQDYATPGFVDETVIDEVAAWIGAQESR